MTTWIYKSTYGEIQQYSAFPENVEVRNMIVLMQG